MLLGEAGGEAAHPGEVEPTVHRRDGGGGAAPGEGEGEVVAVVVDDVELVGALVDHVQLNQGGGDGVLERVFEAQGALGAGDEGGGGAGVAAGEEGDIVAAADELLGEGGDDALGAAVEQGRHRLDQGGDHRDLHGMSSFPGQLPARSRLSSRQ